MRKTYWIERALFTVVLFLITKTGRAIDDDSDDDGDDNYDGFDRDELF